MASASVSDLDQFIPNILPSYPPKGVISRYPKLGYWNYRHWV